MLKDWLGFASSAWLETPLRDYQPIKLTIPTTFILHDDGMNQKDAKAPASGVIIQGETDVDTTPSTTPVPGALPHGPDRKSVLLETRVRANQRRQHLLLRQRLRGRGRALMSAAVGPDTTDAPPPIATPPDAPPLMYNVGNTVDIRFGDSGVGCNLPLAPLFWIKSSVKKVIMFDFTDVRRILIPFGDDGLADEPEKCFKILRTGNFIGPHEYKHFTPHCMPRDLNRPFFIPNYRCTGDRSYLNT